MILGVPAESAPGERGVALVPGVLQSLQKSGLEILVEPGAGAAAGFDDDAYTSRGAALAGSREELFQRADVVAMVRTPGANTEAGRADLELMRSGQVVIGLADPLSAHELTRATAEHGVTLLALELMPRITRAQSMDVLSSMATVAGYKAVLMAADRLPRLFPMMVTAAGTLAAAKVFVVGAGVAGLQAIATARRLGAVVEAYDVRPAVKEQVESLGARFVEMELETGEAEDAGGYARAQDESFYERQRELMAKVVAGVDVVITTAVIPGRAAPVLITAEMVRAMRPGSVIVDLAAERGGNCELTRAGEEVREGRVTVMGPLELPSTVPYHASQMFAKNVSTFLSHLLTDEGELPLDTSDEITAGTLVCRGGEILNPKVREAMGASAEGSES